MTLMPTSQQSQSYLTITLTSMTIFQQSPPLSLMATHCHNSPCRCASRVFSPPLTSMAKGKTPLDDISHIDNNDKRLKNCMAASLLMLIYGAALPI